MDVDARLVIQCDACGTRIKAPPDSGGRRVACPKCGGGLTVAPAASPPGPAATRIDFRCSECSQHLKAPATHAGKRIRCPKCQAVVVVPTPDETPAPVSGGLQFDDLLAVERTRSAVSGSGQAVKRCPACSAGAAGDAVICTACGYDFRSGKRLQAVALAAERPEADGASSGVSSALRGFALGSVLSVLGAAVGAGIWYGLAIATSREYGLVAWGLGALAGGGMYLGLRTSHALGGMIASGVAFIGIWVAKLAIFYAVLAPLFAAAADDSIAEQRDALAHDIAYDAIGGPPEDIDERAPEFKQALERAQREVASLPHDKVIARHEHERVVDLMTYDLLPSTAALDPAAARSAYDEARKAAREKVASMGPEEISAKYAAELAEFRAEFESVRAELEGSFWSIMFGLWDVVFVALAVITAYRVGAGGVGIRS